MIWNSKHTNPGQEPAPFHHKGASKRDKVQIGIGDSSKTQENEERDGQSVSKIGAL